VAEEKAARRLVGNIRDLEAVIDLCLEKGVTNFRDGGGVEFALAPAALAAAAAKHEPAPKRAKKRSDREQINGEDLDEDLLYASSTPPGAGDDPS
jgi:hypothetical protein